MVKRLRRRPLTAKTGVRVPMEVPEKKTLCLSDKGFSFQLNKSLTGFVKYACGIWNSWRYEIRCGVWGIYYISHFAAKAKYLIIHRIISYCIAIFHPICCIIHRDDRHEREQTRWLIHGFFYQDNQAMWNDQRTLFPCKPIRTQCRLNRCQYPQSKLCTLKSDVFR